MIIARDVDSCCRAWCPTLSSHRWTPGHAMAFIFQRYAPSIDGNMMSRYQNVKGNMYLRTRDSCWLNWTWFVSFCFFVAWKQVLECTLFRKSGEDDHTVSEIREMFCLFLCLFVCLFVLFLCFFVSLFLCLFVCLFVCLFDKILHSLPFFKFLGNFDCWFFNSWSICLCFWPALESLQLDNVTLPL